MTASSSQTSWRQPPLDGYSGNGCWGAMAAARTEHVQHGADDLQRTHFLHRCLRRNDSRNPRASTTSLPQGVCGRSGALLEFGERGVNRCSRRSPARRNFTAPMRGSDMSRLPFHHPSTSRRRTSNATRLSFPRLGAALVLAPAPAKDPASWSQLDGQRRTRRQPSRLPGADHLA